MATAQTEGESPAKITSEEARHCAWCHDPPDRYGSHSICPTHAAQLVQQAETRKKERREYDGK